MKKHLLLLLSVIFILSSCNMNPNDDSSEISDDIKRYYNKPKGTDEVEYITELPENHFFTTIFLSIVGEYIDENKIGNIITMEIGPGVVMTGEYLKSINNKYQKGTYSYYKDIESTSNSVYDFFAIHDETDELMFLIYDKALKNKTGADLFISEEEIREIAVKYMYDLTGLTGWENCIKTYINNRSWHHFVFNYKAKNGIVINSVICDLDGFGNIMLLRRNTTVFLENVPVLDIDDQIYIEGAKKYLIEEQKTHDGKTIVDVKDIKLTNEKYLYYLKGYEANAIHYTLLLTIVTDDGYIDKNYVMNFLLVYGHNP